MILKTIILENVIDILTESQMKGTFGGGDEVYGPYELPEIVITCGQGSGRCYACDCKRFANEPLALYGYCEPRHTGMQKDYCEGGEPCPLYW